MSYLLDTNHCIYLKNAWAKLPANRNSREINVLNKFNSITDPFYTSMIVIGELYYGASNSVDKTNNFKRVEELKTRLNVIGVTDDIMRFYGDVRAGLASGSNIENFDLTIACTAIVFNLVLVSNDHIFIGLHPTLKLEDWSV
ncbi:MAG: type II toxin-antitoxin system VapC family toxin [Blastocatellia bacterium]